MTANAEVDPTVARTNAQKNFQQIQENLPHTLVEREEGLPAEIRSLAGSAIKKLRALYLVTGEISDAVSPYTACQAGCDACCHYNVSVFPLEAQYIEAWTGHARQKKPLPAANFHGQPCPFLSAGRCTIYAHRPMACRKHVALTATAHWCATDICNQESFPQLGFSGVADAFVAVIAEDGRGEPLDIRQWFGVAPRIGRSK